MKRRISILVLTIIVSFSFTMSFSAARITPSYSKIEKTLDKYFENRSTQYISDTEEKNREIEFFTEDIASIGWEILEANIDYYINSMSHTKDGYMLEVFEGISFVFKNRIGDLQESYKGIFHNILLDKYLNTIIYDKLYDTSGGVFDIEPFMSEGLSTFISHSTDEIMQRIESTSDVAPNAVTVYSPIAAANYAQTYANCTTGHDGYSYFSDGDCANFVSQCLKEGGLATTSTWYVNSVVWKSSTKLRTFLKDTLGETSIINTPSLSDFNLGYVLFYDWDKDGCSCTCSDCAAMNCEDCTKTPRCSGRTYNHTVICSGFSSDSTPLICGHTDAQLNVPVILRYNINGYSLAKVHTHSGSYSYDPACHWKSCDICGYTMVPRTEHVSYISSGVEKCRICNAVGPFYENLDRYLIMMPFGK